MLNEVGCQWSAGPQVRPRPQNLILVVELNCAECPSHRPCDPDDTGRVVNCYRKGGPVVYQTAYDPGVAEVSVAPVRAA